MPINDGISKDDDGNTVPCGSKVVLNEPLSGKGYRTPAETKEILTKSKTDNVVSESNKPCEHSRESMRRLDRLAQICCDKGGFDSENLLFSRRVTRSMKPSISTPMANRQNTQPTVVHIEDDITSSIPNTTHVNNPTFIKDNGVKLGKAEVAQSCMNTCIAEPEPSFISPQSSGQNIDDFNSPQVANNEETL